MHNERMVCLPLFRPRRVWTCLAALWASQAAATVELRCDVTYAGTSHLVVARPVQDPYVQPTVDIAERFLFKPVMVGAGQEVDRINLYVYQVTRSTPVLVQQAKYLPPFAWPADGSPWPLTGRQHLYAGPLERELIYSCALHRGLP